MIEKLSDRRGKITAKIDVIQLDDSIKKYYVSSKYDVEKEAEDFALNYKPLLKKINILYGLGLGYHVKSLYKILDKNQKLFIFENREDIYNFGIKNSLYDDFLGKENIHIVADKDENNIMFKIKDIIDSYDTNDIYFFRNNACINVIHPKYSSRLKYLMESMKLFEIKDKSAISKRLSSNTLENIKLNDKNSGIFFEKFKNIPAILVSSGASLKYSIDLLKKLENKALIMTVARSVKTLQNENIHYDMCCTMDDSIKTAEHTKDVNVKKAPLFYLSSANNEMVSDYKNRGGKSFISFNEHNEYFEDKYTIDTGGSVATLGLSLLIKFGCNPIIFAGQDFAFVENSTHIDKNDGVAKTNVQVKSNTGDILYTNNNFLSFKYWFEKTIKNNKNIDFYNLSRGAVIENTRYTDEKYIYEMLKENNYDFSKMINDILK